MTIVVVGAGVAGCAAAERLREQGHRVKVLEGCEQVGGRTAPVARGRLLAESGGDTLLSPYAETHRLIDRLGLRDSLHSFDHAAVVHDGARAYRLRAGSPLSYAFTRRLTIVDKVRLLRGFLAALAAPRTNLFSVTETPPDGESLASWSRKRCGENVLRYLVRPAIESRWYFSCEEMPASLGVELIRRAPLIRFQCLEGGIAAMLEPILASVELRTSAPVERIALRPGGVRIVCAGESFDADGVVVATDAPSAAKILPPSPPQVRSLADCAYSQSVRVLFGYDDDPWSESSIAAVNPVTSPPDPVASVSLVSRKSRGLVPAGAEVVAVHLTGAASARLDDREAMAAARAAVARFLPATGQAPSFEHLVRWPRALPLPRPAQLQAVHRIRAELHPRIGLAGDYFGLPTIETAVRSGRDAADRTLVACSAKPNFAMSEALG